MIDLEEIKSRINPQYAETPGTESHDRKMLCDEIEALRQQLAEKDAEIERLYSERGIISGHLIKKLHGQLACSQAREQQLREAIDGHINPCGCFAGCEFCDKDEKLSLEEALAIPADTTALEAIIAKAGEVMRGRCVSQLDTCFGDTVAQHQIRALPGVTMEDLK